MRRIIIVLIVPYFVYLVTAQSKFYRAAVVDYSPVENGNSTTETVIDNIGQYVNFIQKAANENVQIIVFPENGLTGLNVNNFGDIRKISTEIPEPGELISPCFQADNKYGIVLVYLSCAVQVHGIYTVVNLIEKEYNNETREETYFNSNIVFDRNGAIIAKSRNYVINNNTAILNDKNIPNFKTDFGVKFGILSPQDVLSFNQESHHALKNESISDIVYPNTWFTALPFYSAISVIHGFATANEVNLLSASVNNKKHADGGSGIFLSNGKVEEIYQDGEPGSKLIIQNVPIVNPDASKMCKNPQTRKSIGFDLIESVPKDKFATNTQDLSQYSVLPVKLDKSKVYETLCDDEKGSFCCTFDITLKVDQQFVPNYLYMLVIYDGIDKTFATALHVRNCAIVACLNKDISSCGKRDILPPVGIELETIKITSTLLASNTYTQPSTVTFDLTTSANYTFCEQQLNETMKEVTISSNKSDPILTFGLFSKISNENSACLRVSLGFFGVLTVCLIIIFSF